MKISIINYIVKNPYFEPVLLYTITLFGCVAMYIFSNQKGFQGTIAFLKKFFPKRTKLFYYRTDFFLVTIAGSIIGTIFFNPTSTIEALAAGFGWVGAINILMNEGIKL